MLACVCQPADTGIFRKSPIPLGTAPLQLNNKGAIPKPGKTLRLPVITNEPSSKKIYRHKAANIKNDEPSAISRNSARRQSDNVKLMTVDKKYCETATNDDKKLANRNKIKKQTKLIEKVHSGNISADPKTLSKFSDKGDRIETEEIEERPSICNRKEDDKELRRISHDTEKVT